MTLEPCIFDLSGYGKATPANLNCQHVKNTNGFFENANEDVEDFNRDLVDVFAEAILKRDYGVAHGLFSEKLQLEFSEIALLEMIESHCQQKILTHGYEGFHHPIDFSISNKTPFQPQLKNLEPQEHSLERVTIEFYPSVHLEFEVFFRLNVLLHVSDRITNLEIV